MGYEAVASGVAVANHAIAAGFADELLGPELSGKANRFVGNIRSEATVVRADIGRIVRTDVAGDGGKAVGGCRDEEFDDVGRISTEAERRIEGRLIELVFGLWDFEVHGGHFHEVDPRSLGSAAVRIDIDGDCPGECQSTVGGTELDTAQLEIFTGKKHAQVVALGEVVVGGDSGVSA